MRPYYHFMASAITSYSAFLYLKSPKFAIVSFLAGIFIDLDHVLDYYIGQGINFNVKNFYYWCVNTEFKKIFLILHSLEFIFGFWIAIWFFNLGIFWVALAFGFTQHMMLDLAANKVRPQAYFFIFRIWHAFEKEKITLKGAKNENFD